MLLGIEMMIRWEVSSVESGIGGLYFADGIEIDFARAEQSRKKEQVHMARIAAAYATEITGETSGDTWFKHCMDSLESQKQYLL